PPGSLEAALKQLATQSEIELVYQPEQVKDIQTQGLSGSYTPQEAIALLLKGTALQVHTDRTGAMVISPKEAKAPTAGVVGSGKGIRVAQVEDSGPVSEGSGEERLEEVNPTLEKIPEILVQGKKSLNVDIQRTENDAMPYVVFDEKELEQSQA